MPDAVFDELRTSAAAGNSSSRQLVVILDAVREMVQAMAARNEPNVTASQTATNAATNVDAKVGLSNSTLLKVSTRRSSEPIVAKLDIELL